MEWKDELIEMYQTAPFAKLLGISLEFDKDNNAHLYLPFKRELTHEKGGIHGGVFGTLLDDAGWFASVVNHPGVWVATSEFKVHLLRPVEAMDLHAKGWVIKKGKRMDIAEMQIFAEDILVAAGMGTYVVLENREFGKTHI